MSPPGWPMATGEPVVVLADASTAVEREVLDEWVRREHRRPRGDPGPRSRARRPPRPAGRPGAGRRRPVAHPAPGGVAAARARRQAGGTAARRGPAPRQSPPPPDAAQRRITRSQPDRCRVVVGEPARVSALRMRWATVSGDGDRAGAFTDFVARQATLALERAESQLVGAQYKVPRLVREELSSTARLPLRAAPSRTRARAARGRGDAGGQRRTSRRWSQAGPGC